MCFIAGAKLISLNQKQRGFPTGLRVMADDSYRSVTLFIDSSLEKGEMNGLPLTIDEIVVSTITVYVGIYL